MLSIFELLERKSNEIENSIFKTVAEKVLENIKEGKVLKQDELAKQAFVSMSTISKFCKNLGFSGYKEFCFTLKNEWEKINFLKNNDFDSYEVIDDIQKWIFKNNDFVDQLANEIKKTHKLNLFCSYQLTSSAIYFVDLLKKLSINVILYSNEYKITPNQIRDEEPFLLIVSGRDNDTLIINFKKIYDKNNKNFLIITEKQKDKLDMEFNKKLLINFLHDNSNWEIRILAMHMLFYFIYNKLK